MILIGAPGSGKTTVGRLLAQRLSARFLDTDRLIEEKAGLKIAEIFSDLGEGEFRRLEKEVVRGLVHTTNAVIATGGGAVVDPGNFSALQAIGTVVALNAKIQTLKRRLEADTVSRPLLEDLSEDKNPLEKLLQDRLGFYQKADVQIKTDQLSPEEVVNLILEKLKN